METETNAAAMKAAEAETKTPREQLQKPERDAVLDNIRGLVVLLFIAVHFFSEMNKSFAAPGIFTHAYNVGDPQIAWWGFNLVDLGPVIFMLLMGVIIYSNFERKLERKGKAAYKDHIVKNLAVNGLFLMLVYIAYRFMAARNPEHPNPESFNKGWSYMNDIATTALFMTPFLTKPFRKHTWAKFAAAAGLLTVYGLARPALLLYLGTKSPGLGGGMGACVGFAGVVLLVAGVSDLARKKPLYLFISAAALYLAGLLATRVFLPMENLGGQAAAGAFSVWWMIGALSKVYVLYALVWSLCHYALKDKPIPGLAVIGRNLMLYILLGIAAAALEVAFPFNNPVGHWLASLYVALMLALCFLLTIPLSKYKITVKL